MWQTWAATHVSVIDTATNTVKSTVNVGNWPYGVAVTPDGKKVYVTNDHDNTVSVIDTATNKVTATVPVGEHPKAFGQFIGSSPKLVETTTTRTAGVHTRMNHTVTKKQDKL